MVVNTQYKKRQISENMCPIFSNFQAVDKIINYSFEYTCFCVKFIEAYLTYNRLTHKKHCS